MIDRIVVLAERSDVERAVAADVLEALEDAITVRGRADIVLTGGTVGIGSLAAIAAHPRRDSVDWACVRIWWGDERFVPAGDAERNEGQATAALLDSVPLMPANIFRFPASDGVTLDEAREQFATTLQSEFRGDPQFDVVLNGIGPDGHVASLFPGHDHGTPDEYVIAVEDSPKPPTERLSLTFSALNRGERVWIIAAGADKAYAIGELVSGAPEDMIPATALRGTVETALYLDEAAASSIPR